MRVALINTNRMRPPIGPVGLDYVAEAVAAAGHRVSALDLCWEPDPEAAIERFFAQDEYRLVGVTLRNTDDCGYLSRQSFLPGFAATVRAIRTRTNGLIVAGGAGFSVMPETVLKLSGADAGVWADGEFALADLAGRLERGEEWRDLPGLVIGHGEGWRRNLPLFRPLGELPPMTRSWFDNRRYFRHGGQAGFETRRGCPGACVYCADPVAKGAVSRLRPSAAVAGEVECLLAQDIDHFHTCDGEFNIPVSHAMDVCAEFGRRGLADKMRWYAYCSPAPFSAGLAQAMKRAGCAGINFGADSGDPGMLRRLGRGYGPEDIVSATQVARRAGMAVMLDLLLGSPGESRGSLERTVELVKRAGPDRAGVAVGVRVYAGTPLARSLGASADAVEPAFFLEPAVAPFIFGLLDSLIGDDPRFLFFDPVRADVNYNYNDNLNLEQAIARGFRGAYWDILRRLG